MNNTYKVIKIINEYQIVVNVGKNKGISKGQTLEIFVPGEEIIDPDTGESLGALDFIKSYLIVKDVFDKMCICENKENLMSTVSFASLQVRQRLNVDSKEISGGLTGNSKIQIGDLVRKS
ncbi:hypothetical protein [Lysinibacillus parviboronicapiens]|uniref:hypothetical protein n=1 Tax=Lysinibacillus parviboronicapiens TaxID=436516 RepID=UPI0006D01A7F|nr:hypothetical protein [Lysinibacillus parviboronicapiens]